MVNNAYLVIMAGGSGTRFWPKSTSRRPKQLLTFNVEGSTKPKTLLAQTLDRFEGLIPRNQRIVVTTRALSEAVANDCPGVEILAEPQGRNTAPCVYWAARAIAARDPEAIMLVMPADHYIAQSESFRSSVRDAIAWAGTHDDLVTLGVKPTRPETGYGYLSVGVALGKDPGSPHKVDAFVEKPSLERAEEFLRAGTFLWNGGMFLWRARTVLNAFDQFMPELKAVWDESGGRVETAYPKMTATSIDFGVMEKARNVVTFTLDCGWDDLGSWTSLESLAERLGTRRPEGVVTGGELLSVDSGGNIVDVPGKLVALLGVNDLIVVEHGDAVLIADKNRAQDIRLIVEQVKKRRPELA